MSRVFTVPRVALWGLLLAVIVVSAGLATTQTASASVEPVPAAGTGSCNESNNDGVPDPAYCSWDNSGGVAPTIGSNSCTVVGSCTDLTEGATIGDESCNAEGACYNLGNSTSIGNNSCNDIFACEFAGRDGRVGHSSIGHGSCIGTYACYATGASGGGSIIGDGSCIGGNACLAAGDSGTSTIGDNSCHGDFVCEFVAFSGGTITIGHNSCNSEFYELEKLQACYSAASDGPSCDLDESSCDGGTSSIGNNSCNGYNTCTGILGMDIGDCEYNTVDVPACAADNVGKGSCGDTGSGLLATYCSWDNSGPTAPTIGSDSCTFENSCTNLGSAATIGNGSCNGDAACSYAGYAGSSTIGDGSCNGNYACSSTGHDLGSRSTIANGSCNSDATCSYAGYAGSSTIGNGSCNGDPACSYAGYELGSSSTIGDCEFNTVDVPACTITPCQPGSYSLDGNEPCNPAPAGLFVATPGAIAYTACAAGTYQPDEEQTSCLPAPAGSFVATPEATAYTPCAAGTYQPLPGQTSCLLAPVGSFVATPGATEAELCPAGTSTVVEGASECTPIDQVPIDQLMEEILGSNPDAGTFLAQADSIENAPNATAKAGTLDAFTRHVEAQRNKSLTDAQADELIRLAGLL